MNGLEYYNPNPWASILGTANETNIEIDGIISKPLIDSGGMILMMSRGYCEEHRYKIQPLDHLVPIEGSGGADISYLGYVFWESIPLIEMFSCSSVTPLPIIIKGYPFR